MPTGKRDMDGGGNSTPTRSVLDLMPLVVPNNDWHMLPREDDMKLSRQTFQLIAEVLASTDPGYGNTELDAKADTHDETVQAFADRLSATNPNFDRDRFIDVATGKRDR